MVGTVRLAARELSDARAQEAEEYGAGGGYASRRAVGGFRPNTAGQLGGEKIARLAGVSGRGQWIHDRKEGMSSSGWKERAVAAESHNARVGKLLTNYVMRNQLNLPGMPAGLLGAQMSAV